MASSASDHSHKRRTNKSSTLPLDLILHEIFPKLPVKSLLRLKSVCKLFKTVISSPAFIDLHLRQFLLSDVDDRLLILAGRKEDGYLTYAAELNSLELPVRAFDLKGELIIGSCNGLVCMHSRDQLSLIVINPCTKIYKNIPIPYGGHRMFGYGFGYDNINDDFKVLMFSYCRSREKEVRVYSLKSGEWSVPNRTPCPYAIQYMEINGSLVGNNLLYWKFYCTNMQNHIACFDLQTNRWIDQDIPFPDSTRENRIKLHALDRLHLGVVNRCLCLSVRYDDASIIIWVMNEEHGAKQSWVKLATIKISQDIISPSILHLTKLDFRYIDSLVLFAHTSYSRRYTSEIFVNLLSKFWWYDIQPKPWKLVEIKGVPSWQYACICKPSLVSIAGGQTMYNMVRHSVAVNTQCKRNTRKCRKSHRLR